MNLFEKNLALLRTRDLALARRVAAFPPDGAVRVEIAKNGRPVPKMNSLYLHSPYDPGGEAAKTAAGFDSREGAQTVVLGLGYGYHVLELLNKIGGDVCVIEPLMTMFRSFMEQIDLGPFLPRTRFLVAEPEAKILVRHLDSSPQTFLHRPSLHISPVYFDRLAKGEEVAELLGRCPLRVLVVNPIYGGSLPTAHYCAGALKNLGHRVEVVACEEFAGSFHSLKTVTRDAKNTEILSSRFMGLMTEVVLAKAAEFQPDLILALAQAPLTPDALERLKSLGIPIAFWFVEDFRTLPYWKEVAPGYDCFFTIQRGEIFEELKTQGVRDAYYLPQAADPEIHRPMDLSSEDRKIYGAALSFMGAAYYNRVQSFPRLMDFDFKLWGTGWEKYPLFERCLQKDGKRVTPEESVKIYNGGKINLNLHSSTFHEDVNPLGDFVNPRTFEIAACSGFQLVDARGELDELFRAGEEIVTFSNMEELKEKISYYMDHDGERNGIAANSRARVLREHTMEHRMREMLLHIFLNRFDDIRGRLHQRRNAVETFIGQAGKDSELGRYLESFREGDEFSLQSMVEPISDGEGALTQNELLLLMLGQVLVEKG